MRANPGLVKRHQVAQPVRPQNPSLVAAVVQSLGWLRTRLLRFRH